MSKRHQYRLDIATARGITQDESHRSLRAFLKVMLRQWDIKCLSAVAIPPKDGPQDGPQRAQGAPDDI